MEKMDNNSQQFSIRWNNYHANLLTVFEELLLSEAFADVTICLDDGRSVKCHKVVLAACSTYFQDLFYKQSNNHIVIALKDASYVDIKLLLVYMYRGEVSIAEEQMESLIKLAKSYKVKGLSDIDHKYNLQHLSSKSTEIIAAITQYYSSPPRPGVSNISSSHSYNNNRISPAHSTEACYNSQGLVKQSDIIIDPGSELETKSTKFPPGVSSEDDKNFSHLTTRYPVSLYSFPTNHVSGSSTSKADPNSSMFIHMNSPEEYVPEDKVGYIRHKRRALQRYSTPHDTPILRTVLAQRHIESATAQALISSDSNEASRSDAITSVNEKDMREMVNCSNTETMENYYDLIDEENKQPHPPTSSGDMNTSQQKPEWKRYKQYTREDIGKAIEAVKTGMSALQASRIHGVPSRTLYDKVKKLGISSSRNGNSNRSTRGSPRRISSGSSTNKPGTYTPYGITINNCGTSNSSFVAECDNEASSNNFKHETTDEMKTETNSVSVNKVKNDESRMDVDQINISVTSDIIKQEEEDENDEHYVNYEDEAQDLSMHSKNDKVIPASAIKETDSDNSNRN